MGELTDQGRIFVRKIHAHRTPCPLHTWFCWWRSFKCSNSFCLFFDLSASRDEVDQDFVYKMSGKLLCSRFRTNAIYWHKSELLTAHGTTQCSGHAMSWCGVPVSRSWHDVMVVTSYEWKAKMLLVSQQTRLSILGSISVSLLIYNHCA